MTPSGGWARHGKRDLSVGRVAAGGDDSAGGASAGAVAGRGIRPPAERIDDAAHPSPVCTRPSRSRAVASSATVRRGTPALTSCVSSSAWHGAPGVAATTYVYDPASRLIQLIQGTQLFNFEYDDAGRRTRLLLSNVLSTDYQYDAASRLVALTYRNTQGILGTLTYQYDASGNLLRAAGSSARTLLPLASATAT